MEQLYWRLFLQKTKPLKQKHFRLNTYYKTTSEFLPFLESIQVWYPVTDFVHA